MISIWCPHARARSLIDSVNSRLSPSGWFFFGGGGCKNSIRAAEYDILITFGGHSNMDFDL